MLWINKKIFNKQHSIINEQVKKAENYEVWFTCLHKVVFGKARKDRFIDFTIRTSNIVDEIANSELEKSLISNKKISSYYERDRRINYNTIIYKSIETAKSNIQK